MRLKDKVALVTGAAKGIGEAIALSLAREGSDVVINDVDVEPMGNVVDEIKKMGRRSLSIVADVRDKKQVDEMIGQCVKTFGRIDILVNNAGVVGNAPGKPPPMAIGDVTEDIWDWVIDVNLKGTFLCTQAAVKYMKEQKSGKIVNISSIAAKRSLHTLPQYGASKAGILGLTIQVAKEVGRYGIYVNTICPSFVMSGPRAKGLWQKEKDEILSKIALGRTGRPEEVASVVVFLCSEEASFITGATIDVNGGYL